MNQRVRTVMRGPRTVSTFRRPLTQPETKPPSRVPNTMNTSQESSGFLSPPAIFTR